MAVTKVIEIGVQVLLKKEGRYYVAYCPALELSSYGTTESSAMKSFEEAMQIFLEETDRKGTLEKVLLGLGWTLKQKPIVSYKPPALPRSERSLLRSSGGRISEKRVSIPFGFSRKAVTYAGHH